jgi:DNA adenine methylase
MNIPTNAPFKWIGGKKWLSKELLEISNKTLKNPSIETYIEPFIGGLGSFLAILPNISLYNINNIILNDVNETIVNTYKFIKTDIEDLITSYVILEMEYEKNIDEKIYSLNKTKDKIIVKQLLKNAEENFKINKKEFNNLKLKTNKTKIETINESALFLFLMEHCFNGVYRENLKGEFNTPFNWDNKKYLTENKIKTLREYSVLFNSLDITFENMDVFELLKKYNKYEKSSLYLDPPYLNDDEENSKKQENKYNKDDFNINKQKQLLNEIIKYQSFVYSNHKLKLFEDFFGSNNYKIINRKNIMSAKKENRSNDALEILSWKI